MTDIIPFARKPEEPEEKEDLLWCCAHCDSTAFELYSDGTTACRGCGHRGEYPDGRWSDWTPIDDEKPIVARGTTIYDSAAFAQQSIIRQINEETSILVIASDDGKIRLWSTHGNGSSPETKVTVHYLLEQAASLLLGEPPLPRPDNALPVTE